MAQEVSITLVDDINGGPAAETVKFALDGRRYQIDLTAANAKRLRSDFGRWISKSRRDAATTGRTRRATASNNGADSPQVIRAWAAKKRIKVPSRGRIPAAVVEKYQAAGGK